MSEDKVDKEEEAVTSIKIEKIEKPPDKDEQKLSEDEEGSSNETKQENGEKEVPNLPVSVSIKKQGEDDETSVKRDSEAESNEDSLSNASKKGVDEDSNEEQKEKEMAKETKPALGILTVKKSEDLIASPGGSFSNMASLVTNGEFVESSAFPCSVCLLRFPTATELESHKAQASHYVCNMAGAKCAAIGFSSAADLAAHQAEAHQGPVQQLAQQVERIPVSYSAQPYQNQMSFQNSRSPQLPLGSQVMLTPVVQQSPQPHPNIPNLPGIQVTKRPANAPEPAPAPKIRREDNTGPSIRLPDSITLVKPSQVTTQKKDDSVANMLATRGITVLPSSSVSRSPRTAQINTAQLRRNTPSQLNSSVSITPSSRQVKPQLPTVDLTQEVEPRRRAGMVRRLVCQICDKVFQTQEALNAHVNTHRTQSKLPFECELCTAQYPTQQGLDYHRQKFHGRRTQISSTSVDMALPVVDIRQPGVKQKLLQVGVRHVLMLSQLHNRAGTASFGLPIVPVDLANNQAYCSLGDMGVSNLLPLGALQSLQ
ncbi:uncharacterized protein LOC106662539 isoform X2 [Cimex lectularius]|nr:uncharacterized protein LOC106662539 isoform X2 [Cimex lectularius]